MKFNIRRRNFTIENKNVFVILALFRLICQWNKRKNKPKKKKYSSNKIFISNNNNKKKLSIINLKNYI